MLIAYGYCKMRTKIPKVARFPSVIFFPPEFRLQLRLVLKVKGFFFCTCRMRLVPVFCSQTGHQTPSPSPESEIDILLCSFLACNLYRLWQGKKLQ